MQRLQLEYAIKGLFLGLLLYVALQVESWNTFAQAVALMTALPAVLFTILTVAKLREGYRLRGRLFPFVLFLLLESPLLLSIGTILGMVAAVALVRQPNSDRFLVTAGLGGAAGGLLVWLLRYVRQRWVRFSMGLFLSGILITAVLLGLGRLGELGAFGEKLLWNLPLNPALFGATLLVGIPFFYLLTFAGQEEETELEVGAMCAALGLGVGLLMGPQPSAQSMSYLLPIVIYFWYTTRVMPKLRVFKHAIRGYTYAQAGRHRQAILAFRRAMQFDPQNKLAREGLWSVHRALDLTRLPEDPQTLAVVDLDLCLERAATLLSQPPSAEQLTEALRLLDLIQTQRPNLRSAVHYWRAVAHTHARKIEEGTAELQQVLDPSGYAANDAQRQAILLPAWQLALRSRPELAQGIGQPQLALPRRRLEAIGAVERHLTANPEDAEVWGFKRVLYQDLTEADYDSAVEANTTAADFDHGYVLQLGLSLINNPERWQRGCEYLRLAARGLPEQAPSIYVCMARACQQAAEAEAAWTNYEAAKRAGRAIGPKNLGAEDRQAYFVALKILAEAARQHGRLDLAIENYHLYTEYERSGLETLRILMDLYERKGEPLAALRVLEQALLYNGSDKDLLERKDKYYYSVMPDNLRARLDWARSGFDVDYCLKKARALLDGKNWDLDTLDWAEHLAALASVVRPDSQAGKVLVARARLRRGEKQEAVALLEAVRLPRPEKFASGEDQDAWYLACKLLGDLYLHDLARPDLAVECLRSFRESTKSGADTLYKLGQAYEQLGDAKHAVKYYEHVVSYDRHPLAPEARDALQRLKVTG
jgi:tetratricopeptide (TPR) repeat protein